MKLDNRGSWGLIALLVVAAIIMIWAAMYFGKNGGAGLTTVGGKKNHALLDSKSKKQTIVGQSLDTAKSADCRERLIQVRTGIYNYQTTENGFPHTLKDIELGVGADYFQCPVSKQPYTYDPETGTVKCPTHSNY